MSEVHFGGLSLQNVAFTHLQQLFASGVKAAVFLPVKFRLFCFIFLYKKSLNPVCLCVYVCVCL